MGSLADFLRLMENDYISMDLEDAKTLSLGDILDSLDSFMVEQEKKQPTPKQLYSSILEGV